MPQVHYEVRAANGKLLHSDSDYDRVVDVTAMYLSEGPAAFLIEVSNLGRRSVLFPDLNRIDVRNYGTDLSDQQLLVNLTMIIPAKS